MQIWVICHTASNTEIYGIESITQALGGRGILTDFDSLQNCNLGIKIKT